MHWSSILALIFRQVAVFALFAVVVLVALGIGRLIPEGRVKRFLTKPHHVVPQSEEDLRDWTPALVAAGFIVLIWGGIIACAFVFHW